MQQPVGAAAEELQHRDPPSVPALHGSRGLPWEAGSHNEETE